MNAPTATSGPRQLVLRSARWVTAEILVRVTFGTFMGGLVLLLILLYSGVPIV